VVVLAVYSPSPPVAASLIVSKEAVVDEAAAYAVIQRRSAAGLRIGCPSSGEIAVDDPIEVAVELGPQWPSRELTHAGKAGVEDLPDVVVDPQVRTSLNRWTLAGKQLAQAYRGLLDPALGRYRLV
jgi:hypothetical protein